MKLRSRGLLLVLMVSVNVSRAADIGSANNRTGAADHWSILPASSVFDSLRIQVKKAVLPNNANALNEYIRALQFRELLIASDNPLPAYPISAGIYHGSLTSDSLSADDQLLSLYRNLGDRRSEAAILSSLGTKAAVNGDMHKALTFFNSALELNIGLNERPAIIKNYFSLARVHRYKGNFSEAVNDNQAVVQLAQQINNNRYLAEAYMNLADLWSAQKKFKEAEALIMGKLLALNYYKLKDYVGTIQCYSQLAQIYQQQRRFSEAKWFYIQSNLLARKINYTPGIVNSLVNLAHVKMSIGDHSLALRDFREAEQLSVSNKYSYQLVEIKNDLSRVYAMLGNKSASSSALSEFTVLKDALLNSKR
ncbi:MAG: tetratricopeptide repeat protein [Daejeonella sp.]